MPRDLLEEAGMVQQRAPRDLLAEQGFSSEPENKSMPIDIRLGADVLAGLAKMGHGIINTPSNVANYLSNKGVIEPEIAAKIPRQKEYDYSAMLGIPKPNLGDKLLQGAAQYAPLLPFSELSIPNAVAGGVFGATQSENPALGFGLGAAGQVAPAATIKGIKAIPEFVENFHPQKFAENMLQELGKGKKIGAHTKEMADDIANAFSKQKEISDSLYNPIIERYSGESIYPYNQNYLNLDEDVINSFTPQLKRLHKKFLQDATFNDAHTMQSELQNEIRRLNTLKSRGDIGAEDYNNLQNYKFARQALKNDIKSFFDKYDPKAGQQYQKATDFYRENVSPYFSDRKLAEIATGLTKNPGANIVNIFKNPEANIQKVIGDLGPDFLDKITFANIGKTKSKINPKEIADAIAGLESQGLGEYITPKVANLSNVLNKRIKYAKKIPNIRILKNLTDLVEDHQGVEAGDLAKSLYEMNKPK